jgi:hypothetical protein
MKYLLCFLLGIIIALIYSNIHIYKSNKQIEKLFKESDSDE